MNAHDPRPPKEKRKLEIKKNKYNQLRAEIDAELGLPKGVGTKAETLTFLPPYEDTYQTQGTANVLLDLDERRLPESLLALFDEDGNNINRLTDEEFASKKENASKRRLNNQGSLPPQVPERARN